MQLLVAPVLVAAATVAARRWGHRVGGLVSAFPAIVGPVLWIGTERHGSVFAAKAATATLVGLASLSAFALACGRTAPHVSWPVSLAAGWAFAAVVAAVISTVEASLTGALAIAVTSLVLAHRGLAPGVLQAHGAHLVAGCLTRRSGRMARTDGHRRARGPAGARLCARGVHACPALSSFAHWWPDSLITPASPPPSWLPRPGRWVCRQRGL